MTGWQLAMQMYHVAPTPLADREPFNEPKPRTKEVRPITDDEFSEWRQQRADGLTILEIASLAGRWPSVVRRYLSMEGEA